jgi:hypothetical protein
VAQDCNPNRDSFLLGRLRQENCKFKVSLGYVVRLFLKKQNKGWRHGSMYRAPV